MGLDAALQAVADRAHVQVHALQRAEGALDFGQALVIQDGGFGAHAGRARDDRSAEAATRSRSREALPSISFSKPNRRIPTRTAQHAHAAASGCSRDRAARRPAFRP